MIEKVKLIVDVLLLLAIAIAYIMYYRKKRGSLNEKEKWHKISYSEPILMGREAANKKFAARVAEDIVSRTEIVTNPINKKQQLSVEVKFKKK